MNTEKMQYSGLRRKPWEQGNDSGLLLSVLSFSLILLYLFLL